MRFMYIIDGNNLGGKMRMLGEADFGRRLLGRIMEWNVRRRVKITVVFDGGGNMGDRQALDPFVSVVYTPRDSFYRDADDKIVELVRQGSLKPGEALVLVTEDRELISRADAEAKRYDLALEIVSSSSLAAKLEAAVAESEPEDRGLAGEEVDKINSDLLRSWKK